MLVLYEHVMYILVKLWDAEEVDTLVAKGVGRLLVCGIIHYIGSISVHD
jgi:hypothetical protein